MSDLPKIVPHPLPEFFKRAKKMEGKTIKKIEYGYEEPVVEDAQNTEALSLEFTDGTKVGIVLGSNAGEFSKNPEKIKLNLTFRWNDE